ncbi:type IV pilus assembly protein PilW [Collimonas sp. PA-H2]|uniref:PilW family protein n=1 Tax=Collimonas sp. PA-H2 TaxID=1881062 RepID=UPI000BF6F05E|nr:PilW family protein [Collimonas sp. PA-H2]PFH11997.1 type IV pilus assembly protein PilW [Collimonas sp. PA-H2]
MNRANHRCRGFSLVELMVAMAIGLFVSGAVISVYLVQAQMYKSSASQVAIQNAENAIAALVTPVIRSAGFNGCSSVTQSLSNLNAGGPPPLGTIATKASLLSGYDAAGTAGSGSALSIAQDNSANDVSAGDWSPALDSTLTGNVETGSDVLVLLGAAPDTGPIGVTAIAVGSNTMTLQSAAGLGAGQIGIISDCLKASIFQITAVSANTITHATGSGAMTNSSAALAVNYAAGSQFVPLQQTAFYVAHGVGDQSALMRAVYSNGAWAAQPLVPGVETMQVLYGIGANGIVTQYVAAGAVSDWTKVYAIRLGFLVQGLLGSGTTSNTASRQFSVLGTTVTVPADGRLRHVYELSINLRNAV